MNKNLDRPNILVVMADSLAPHFTEPYGDRVAATPNLARFAKESVLFERAYCNSPLCAPSRASLVTGRYVSSLAAYDNANEFSSEWPTIGHVLGGLGYDATIIGKMHFIGHDQSHGFQRLAIETDYTSKYSADNLRLAYDWDQPSAGNPAGSDWMGPSYVRSERWNDYRHHYDRDETIHREAVRYLSASGTNPFFACVSYHAPHNPFWIPAEYRDRFLGRALPTSGMLSDLETCHGPMDRWLNDFHYVPEIRDRLLTRENLDWLYATFYGMILDWDRRLGELLDLIERQGVAERTAVMVIADHGDMMAHRGMVQKRCFYERSLRIPWLCRLPGRWRCGARLATPVSLVDLLPTLAEVAGAPVPEGLPGRSLRLSLEEGVEPSDRPVFAEYHGEGVHAPCFAMVRGTRKFVYVHGHERRLYDVGSDPDELRNLAADPGHAGDLERMQGELLKAFDPEVIARDARARQRGRQLIHRSHLAQRSLKASGATR
jgi:choline-sulfatase